MQVDPSEFLSLDLRVHRLLEDVPPHDVWRIELAGGGPGRTLADLPELAPGAGADPGDGLPLPARLLFALRGWLGRVFGWDAERHSAPEESFASRLTPEDRARSLDPPGTALGAFRILYRFERETLLEIRNATVHAFLASALAPNEEGDGYRLYLAIYVRPVSRWTGAYMTLIDPFRHWIVYPALIRRLQRAWAALALAVALLLPLPAGAGAWDLPAAGACTEATLARAESSAEDASPFPFRPGDVIDFERAGRLRDWIPDEIWQERERFFFDGMQLEIGPCFRDYDAAGDYRDATERFRGRASLDSKGRLLDYTAGQPFPADTIDPDDPSAAQYWAWNWVKRYRGGGRFGDLRLSWVGRNGVAARFVGDFFWVLLEGRADLAASDYRVPFDTDTEWVSGGETRNLSNGSTCAWRQYATDERRPDIFFWSPGARRVVRGVSPDSEGPFSGCLSDTASSSLFLHGESPQLHEWRVLGVRDLLAPINGKTPAFPEAEDRDFGPWGISFANDRWELRRVLVLEGRLREGRFEDRVHHFVWYLDLQTLAPLYYVGLRDGGESGGVGYFLHRWSEDRADYPRWPDGRSLRVLDAVGSALVDWTGKHSVRMERWNTLAVPPEDKRVRRMISQSSLRGR